MTADIAGFRLSDGPVVPAHLHTLHLPAIGAHGPTAANADALAQEMTLYRFLRDDPGQKRARIVWDKDLHDVARARCADMLIRQYFSHVDPDGVGPNELLRRAGVQLPDWYGRDLAANYVESLSTNSADPVAVWRGLLQSPRHRDHVLGLTDFYGGQYRCAVGYARSGDYTPDRIWVVWAVITVH